MRGRAHWRCLGACRAAGLPPSTMSTAPPHVAAAPLPLGHLGLPAPPLRCSVMQDCKASKGLEQMAELLAAGKMKVHLER